MESDHPSHRILIVEDDIELATMVAEFLRPEGFDVVVETRGDAAITRILQSHPAAVVLDVNLPGADGFCVCRTVRTQYRGAIIMLTARGEEVDELLGLEVGADDYMAKPVKPRVLLARLKIHLERSIPSAEDSHANRPLAIGGLTVDPSRRTVELHGIVIDLTTAEFDLLTLLAHAAGQIVTRNEIYQRIHGMRYDGCDRSIDLRISRLRKKLGDDSNRPQRIKSIRGVGYMLSAEP